VARIALCQEVLFEYTGYMSLSAVLKRDGHDVRLFLAAPFDDDGFAAEVAGWRPDVVGFSVLTPGAPWVLRTAAALKARAPAALVVLGNIHAMLFPAELLGDPAVDAVCLGEGEEPLRELAACLDGGLPWTRIAGFWVRGPDGRVHRNARLPPCDLDALPFADRGLYDRYRFFRDSRYLRVALGRGCPYACAFCSNALQRKLHGPGFVRKRSPARAVAEIEALVALHHPRTVYFTDEVLWVDNAWLREFLALYRDRVGLPFHASWRFGPVEEADVRLLARAGCRSVFLATETGDESRRRHQLNKHVTDAHVRQVAGWLRRYGILFECTALFGLPGDSADAHLAELAFFRDLRPSYVWTAFFHPYPGLALTRRLEADGALPRRPFQATWHHEPYLDLPDAARLADLKKAYPWLVAFPALEPAVRRLIGRRLPGLFDLAFLAHFAWHDLFFDQLTPSQFLAEVLVSGVAPALQARLPAGRLGRAAAAVLRPVFRPRTA
jgi:radical SAM superfamily enzyme YgiQ (UPF0313 family)